MRTLAIANQIPDWVQEPYRRPYSVLGDNPEFPSPEGLAISIQGHWKRHFPKFYKEAKADGDLAELSKYHAYLTLQADLRYRAAGYDQFSSWSEAMREYALARPS